MLALIFGIVIVLQTLLLVYILVKSRWNYDGILRVFDTPEGKTFSLELESSPEHLDSKSRVIFKVRVVE